MDNMMECQECFSRTSARFDEDVLTHHAELEMLILQEKIQMINMLQIRFYILTIHVTLCQCTFPLREQGAGNTVVLGDFDGDKNIDAICWSGQESKIDIVLNINSKQG